MNEIKFRGYSKKLNKWIYGMPSYNFKYIFNKESDNSPENYEVEPESVGMYTTLKDKNGVEIYVGDLIKIEKGHKSNLKIIFEITFHQGAFCTKPLEDIDNSRSVSFICYRDQLIREGYKADVSKYIEKIGNIYENKNLLP